MDENYNLVCRVCLTPDMELYKLDAHITTAGDINDECAKQKTSLMECLQYCTRLPDSPELPIYICIECASALEVAYNFIRNALRAHNILCRKFRLPIPTTCYNQNFQTETEKKSLMSGTTYEDKSDSSTLEKTMRFRCKVCNEKLESKKSLKDHVRQHLDIISYCCQLCNFKCKKRSHLSMHYTSTHDIEPSNEQLKAKTLVSPTKLSKSKHGSEDEISTELKATHNKSNNGLNYFKGQSTQQHVQQVNLSQTQTQNDCLLLERPKELEVTAEMSIGNEFIVMADDTVEENIEKGVVIEYIDVVDEYNLTLENQSLFLNDVVNMDVDDIIIEENDITEVMQDTQTIGDTLSSATSQESMLNETANDVDVLSKKTIKCKICASSFLTQDQLKTHMLTHNEIPHFFCDRCPFYTFFRVDLTQHYKMLHNLEPTYKQLLPKNKVRKNDASCCSNGSTDSGETVESSVTREGMPISKTYIYNCDMCLYETNVKNELRRHYQCKHKLIPTDVQLRPTMVADEDDDVYLDDGIPAKKAKHIENSSRVVKRNFPKGFKCQKCNKTFELRSKLKEHVCHNKAVKQEKIAHYIQKHSPSAKLQAQKETKLDNPADKMAFDVTHTVTATTSSISTASTTTSTYTVPYDALPQVVEIDEIITDNTEVGFDFNQDELFDDFDEENTDNGDIEGVQNLLLTSDDEFEDVLNEQSEVETASQPYCIHCNKTFFSNYQFENHMFVHRGLAPYRCEMCTNIYNTKRGLIRHYKAVHKRTPTRDMIQAKGDKVSVDKLPVEQLNLEKKTSSTLMCAKCPYESTELNRIQIHLKTSHGIFDEHFILHKLPFECPRCIRSYETKASLLRHLERSHSIATIIEQRLSPLLSSSSPAASHSGAIPVSVIDSTTASVSEIADPICGSTLAELNRSLNANASVNSNVAINSSGSTSRM